jgi:hypothetical protein
MTRDIKVGDFIKVTSKTDPYDIWVDEMDQYVNDSIGYKVKRVLARWGGTVELNYTDYIFPLASVELIEVTTEDEPVLEGSKMNREIKVGDFVKVVNKNDPYDIWVKEMDQYVNDGIGYEVVYISEGFGGNVDLSGTDYMFPLTSVELIEVTTEDEQVCECCGYKEAEFKRDNYKDNIEPIEAINNTRPVYQKTVYSRVDSHETYNSEKEAMIAHFDEQIKSLVLFRGNFNISTVIENLDVLISELKMMKSYNITEME